MILTKDLIIEAIKKKFIEFEPFDEDQVQGASLDLRIGPQIASTSTEGKIIDLKEKTYINLEPGDTAVFSSYEILKFDNKHLARIGLRSKYARQLHATIGPQIDPGFTGRLFIGVTNLAPSSFPLEYKDYWGSIEIHKLQKPATKYKGAHQEEKELKVKHIKHIIGENNKNVLYKMFSDVDSLKKDVDAIQLHLRLKKEIKKEKYQFNSILWTVLTAVITLFLTLLFYNFSSIKKFLGVE